MKLHFVLLLGLLMSSHAFAARIDLTGHRKDLSRAFKAAVKKEFSNHIGSSPVIQLLGDHEVILDFLLDAAEVHALHQFLQGKTKVDGTWLDVRGSISVEHRTFVKTKTGPLEFVRIEQTSVSDELLRRLLERENEESLNYEKLWAANFRRVVESLRAADPRVRIERLVVPDGASLTTLAEETAQQVSHHVATANPAEEYYLIEIDDASLGPVTRELFRIRVKNHLQWRLGEDARAAVSDRIVVRFVAGEDAGCEENLLK